MYKLQIRAEADCFLLFLEHFLGAFVVVATSVVLTMTTAPMRATIPTAIAVVQACKHYTYRPAGIKLILKICQEAL